MKFTRQSSNMINQSVKNKSKIAYYIDFSVQEIPSIAYIAYETGGTIYTNSELTFNSLQKDHSALSIKCFRTIKEIREDMIKAGIRVIIYPDYHIRFFKDLSGIKHVQVFHGISDKIYDYRRDILNYDLFFIPGSESYNRYEKKRLLQNNSGVLIGYPKLDRVFKGELSKKEELQKLGLDRRNKTVLYAPTWVDKACNSSWKKFHGIFVRGIPENLNLIVKLHPNLMRYRENEVKELSMQLARCKNARLLESFLDIVLAMAASDLLIGDVSSVTREYLAFRRPFIFLSNRPKWMWSKRKTKLWECGEIVTNSNNMWYGVERALDNPDRYLEVINRHFRNTFFKPDGKASKRAADAINKLIR